MKNLENRVAIITNNGEIIVNKDHEDYKNGNLYAGIIFAYIDKYKNNSVIVSIINQEVRGLSKDNIVDLEKEEIIEFAIDKISKRIASNYHDYVRCLGLLTFKQKLKEKIFGYKGRLSEYDRHIQKELSLIINKKR